MLNILVPKFPVVLAGVFLVCIIEGITFKRREEIPRFSRALDYASMYARMSCSIAAAVSSAETGEKRTRLNPPVISMITLSVSL